MFNFNVFGANLMFILFAAGNDILRVLIICPSRDAETVNLRSRSLSVCLYVIVNTPTIEKQTLRDWGLRAELFLSLKSSVKSYVKKVLIEKRIWVVKMW